jgi:integration host factor subunit alpha
VERGSRIGRNPKTGTTVEVPPKRVVRFKSGRLLKEKVQNDSSQDAPAQTDTSSDISPQGQ